jgi:two-component system chemotaxis response regulator CheY
MTASPTLEELEKRAKSGDAEVARSLALFFELGGNGQPDIASARKHWELAAGKGDGFAMTCLAEIIERGSDGSTPAPALANQMRARAGEAGSLSLEDRMKLLNEQADSQSRQILDRLANKVLVVEDSDIMRKLICATLRKEGFAVIEAVDGADGIKKLRELINVKLIISDINMPRMNGLEMITQIRKVSEYKELPIVVLSTETNIEIIKQAKANGIAGWLVKPPKDGSLEALARRFVGGKSNG